MSFLYLVGGVLQSCLLIPNVHEGQIQVLLASLGLRLLFVHVQFLLQYNSIFYTFEIIIFDIILESFYYVFVLRFKNFVNPFLLSYSVCLNSLGCLVHE